MPHRASIVVSINRLLDDVDVDQASRARASVLDSKDLWQAAEGAGLFAEEKGEDHRAAIEGLMAASPSVAAALHGAMTSAAERSVPLVLQWKPGAAIEAQVWEAVEDGVGQIGVLLVTPYGRDMDASNVRQ